MKAFDHIIESTLIALPEAIQKSQLEKARRVIRRRWTGGFEHVLGDNAAILRRVGMADPTVEVNEEGEPKESNDALRGKYGSWILSQYVKMAQAANTADWIRQNPREAFSKGLIELTDEELENYDEVTDQDLENAANVEASIYDRAKVAQHDVIHKFEEVRRALDAHNKLSKFGRTEEYDVPADINRVPDVETLLQKLGEVDPETIHSLADIRSGKVDPLKVEGSIVYAKTKKFVVYEITSYLAAMFHGAGTDWCFRNENSARFYTELGPLYVVYVHAMPSPRWGGYPIVRSNSPGYYKFLAVSPYSNNVDTFEDYPERDLWEIRKTDNKWFDDVELSEESGLMHILSEIATKAMSSTAYQGAQGFHPWTIDGVYEPHDIGWDPESEDESGPTVSHDGSMFMNHFGYSIAAVDDEGDINVTNRVDPDSIVFIANMQATEGPIRNVSGNIYVNVSADVGEDAWDEVYQIVRGQLIPSAVEEYHDLLWDKKAELWNYKGRESWREDLKMVFMGMEDDGIVEIDGYKVPYSDIVDWLDQVDDSTLDQLAQDGRLEWMDPDYDLDADPEPDTSSAAEFLGPEQILDGIGFTYYDYPSEDDEEDEEDEESVAESRLVMRRIMTGATR